ncbi:MAG: hypothetical protein GX984_07090 [Erysipelothrix sp.]|nr:hypothetical protein [Erysipelothrix sp.]
MNLIFGNSGTGNEKYRGLVKIKLVHSSWGSLIMVDQVYLKDPMVWFQPLTSLPSIVFNTDEGIVCRLSMDINGSHTLVVEFTSNDLCQSLDDGSFLYECNIWGPSGLGENYSSCWEERDGIPHLVLFHHTDERGYYGILESGEIWASPWNIQGTRKLINIHYVYFTNLDKIRSPQDLTAIAMSSDKIIHLAKDGAKIPQEIPPNWKETWLRNEILELEVYECKPEARKYTIKALINSTFLASNHLLRHDDFSIWYEVSFPAIFRVGVSPGSVLKLEEHQIYPSDEIKRVDYVVIGDATTLHGLAAPANEEDTEMIFRIHRDISEPPLEYWINNSNEEQFLSIRHEFNKFEIGNPSK